MTGAPPHISIGHLRAVTNESTVKLPNRVVEVLATVGPDTNVLVYDVSARSFAAVIRRTYSKQEPNLVPFIGPLEALGDELVLICQVEHGDELVTVVLRATDRTLVAATAIDRSVGVVHITVQELCARLRASDAPGAELALEVASQCPAEERVRIFEQGALSTARTFLTKYHQAPRCTRPTVSSSCSRSCWPRPRPTRRSCSRSRWSIAATQVATSKTVWTDSVTRA